MSNKTVSIRVNSAEWEAFKEIADISGMSRNSLINLFIHSVVIGKTQIEQKSNIMNINVNLIPISNSNTNVLLSQTKVMKNELILDEIKATIKRAYEASKSEYNRNKGVPLHFRERLRKLIEKASYIPPELFEEAKKIIIP